MSFNYMGLTKKIVSLYGKGGYFARYGGDAFTSIIIIAGFIALSLCIGILIHVKSMRANWDENRYKPGVMPFAGLVNPQQGQSFLETNEKNFSDYLVNVGSPSLDFSLSPQTYLISIFSDVTHFLNTAMNDLRGLINSIRTALMGAFSYIINRLMAIMSTVSQLLHKMSDTTSKMGGVFVTILNALKGYILVSDNFLVGLYRLVIALVILMGVTALMMGFPIDLLAIPIVVLMGLIIKALLDYKSLLGDYFEAQNLPSNLRNIPALPK